MFQFSSYFLDTNKHQLRTVVSVRGSALKFIKLVKTKSSPKFENHNGSNSITLSDEEILAASEYFFR